MSDVTADPKNRPSYHYWLRRFPATLDLLVALVLLVAMQTIVDAFHGRPNPIIPSTIGSWPVAALTIAAMTIAGGLAAGIVAEQMRCAWSARFVRGIALLAAALFFGFTALWYGVIANAALSGASLLFISARCAMASFAHLVDWTAIVRDT